MKKFLLVEAYTAYNLSNYFLEHLKKQGEAEGYAEFVTLRPEYPEDFEAMENLFRENELDMVVNFNGSVKKKFYEHDCYPNTWPEIPFLHWYIDPPAHQGDRHVLTTQNGINAFIDIQHMFYAEQIHKNLEDYIFLPHGCSINPNPKSFEERSIPLALIGSYQPTSYAADTIKEKLGQELQDVAWGIIEYLKDKPEIDTNLLTVEFLKEDIANGNLEPLAISMLVFIIDNYLRNYRRDQMVKQLKDQPVAIFGNGWEDCPFINSNHKLMGGVDFEELLTTMNDIQVVINNIPGFINGSHERPLYAMGQGCAVISNSNQWFEQQFNNEQEIYYTDGNFSNLSDKINEFQSLPMELKKQLTQNAYNSVKKNHLWIHRLMQAEDYRMNHRKIGNIPETQPKKAQTVPH